jgi:hypothetical protein
MHISCVRKRAYMYTSGRSAHLGAFINYQRRLRNSFSMLLSSLNRPLASAVTDNTCSPTSLARRCLCSSSISYMEDFIAATSFL